MTQTLHPADRPCRKGRAIRNRRPTSRKASKGRCWWAKCGGRRPREEGLPGNCPAAASCPRPSRRSRRTAKFGARSLEAALRLRPSATPMRGYGGPGWRRCAIAGAAAQARTNGRAISPVAGELAKATAAPPIATATLMPSICRYSTIVNSDRRLACSAVIHSRRRLRVTARRQSVRSCASTINCAWWTRVAITKPVWPKARRRSRKKGRNCSRQVDLGETEKAPRMAGTTAGAASATSTKADQIRHAVGRQSPTRNQRYHCHRR